MSQYKIFSGLDLTNVPSLRGKHGHTVGKVDADTIEKVRTMRAHNPRMSLKEAVKKIIPTDDVYFDAKYQTIRRALHKT